MSSRKGYIIVEGKGEVEAVQNLVSRLSPNVGLRIPWTVPRRWQNLQHWEAQRGGLYAGAEHMRSKKDIGALLILKDEDDGCPKELAPAVAEKLRTLSLPFPTAYVLFKPEYEVLFLPCLDSMGFPPWDGSSWESRRGVKEWLSKQLPRGRSYKETVDQLRFTQKIDFEKLEKAQVPCFGTLCRALSFIADSLGQRGLVYPF